MTKNALSVLLIAATLLAASSVYAQGSDPAAAQALFDDAKKLVGDGKFAEACPKFLSSFKLDAKPGTVVNLADCYERNGQFASAWVRYLEGATLAQRAGQAEREAYAREHAKALEPKLSRVTISAPAAPPKGLEVLRDGQIVDPAILGAAVPVDPGKHVIEARAPGKKSWSKEIEVTAGAPKTQVDVPALDDAPSATPTERPGDATPPPAAFWTTRRYIGVGVAGVGLVSVVIGSVLGASALGKISDAKSQGHCNSSMTICDATGLSMQSSAAGAAHGSTATLIIGGAAIAGGAVLFLTGGPSANAQPSARLTIGPVASGDMTGAIARGSF